MKNLKQLLLKKKKYEKNERMIKICEELNKEKGKKKKKKKKKKKQNYK